MKLLKRFTSIAALALTESVMAGNFTFLIIFFSFCGGKRTSSNKFYKVEKIIFTSDEPTVSCMNGDLVEMTATIDESANNGNIDLGQNGWILGKV